VHPDAATWCKVGVREGDRLVLLHAPPSWDTIGSLARTVVRRRTAAHADVVVTFHRSRATLEREAPALGDLFVADGMAWVAWPRKAAGHASDLSDQVLLDVLLPTGLVDVKVAMLDVDWSGLKFVWRTELRAARR
jgi:hypothetical protein